jgi:nicotinic acid mononucleotide adenylyltransferase
MGCFNPPTIAHCRLLLEARSFIEKQYPNSLLEGVISPVGDDYARFKPTLLSAAHRVSMCQLAINEMNLSLPSPSLPSSPSSSSSSSSSSSPPLSSSSIKQSLSNLFRVTEVEVKQLVFISSNKALDLIAEESATRHGLRREEVKCVLVCGGDLFASLTRRELWEMKVVEDLLSKNLILVVVRPLAAYGIDTSSIEACRTLAQHDPLLSRFQHHINFLDQSSALDISSTQVRTAVRHSLSIRFLVPLSVEQYISSHSLYSDPDLSSSL